MEVNYDFLRDFYLLSDDYYLFSSYSFLYIVFGIVEVLFSGKYGIGIGGLLGERDHRNRRELSSS